MRGRKPKNVSLIHYLGRMAVRQNVDPAEFFDSIVEAWKRGAMWSRWVRMDLNTTARNATKRCYRRMKGIFRL